MAGAPTATAASSSAATGKTAAAAGAAEGARAAAGAGARGAARGAARSLAFVEVRKNAESTTWYDAQLRDVCAGQAVVSFEGNVWPDREVPCFSVRARPAAAPAAAAEEEEASRFQPGSRVEVLVAASARSPPGWASGVLKAALDGGDAGLVVQIGSKEYTVAAEAVRPVSAEPPLDPMVIVRRAVPVPAELRAWLTTQDAKGCLEQVRVTAGLSLTGAGSATGGILPGGTAAATRAAAAATAAAACDGVEVSPEAVEGLANAVVLLGSEPATKRGEMLLKVHLMHQQAVEAYHARRVRKTELLDALRQRAEGAGAAARATFQVEAGLIGRLCGKGGERLKKVGAEHGVEVRVLDGSDDAAPRTVIILGDSDGPVARAREELELLKEDYAVEEERVGFVLSKVPEISRSTGLAYGKWTGKALELCGTRQQIDDAVMVLDNHNEYFAVFEEMGRQRQEIQRSFEALDEAAVAAGLAPPANVRKATQRGGGSKGSRGRGRGGYPASASATEGPIGAPPSSDGGGGDRGRGAAAANDDDDDDRTTPPTAGGGARGRGRGRGRGGGAGSG